MTPIQEGYDVFTHDGDKAFGAVRRVSKDGIMVYVEAAGDFEIPMSAVKEVQAGKVVLDAGKLTHELRRAIGHAHQGEDPKFG
ncbi:MAG TPA: hypothetical protein VHU87_15500 [Rhizomicrobium sp.]|jgi:hypothetical protein|nr:hypothetical protein [Rhizomicrobium sp.]